MKLAQVGRLLCHWLALGLHLDDALDGVSQLETSVDIFIFGQGIDNIHQGVNSPTGVSNSVSGHGGSQYGLKE